MSDIGLVTGVKALWQEHLLYDYTVKVEGREFKTHKVVLASVSQYFKAMLGEGFLESKTDEIELKGLSADVLSKVIELIYTGDEDIIKTDALDVLKCAIYLQMPLVADICVGKLLEGLNHKNCLELYSVFHEYSLLEAVETVDNFIQMKWKTVFEVCNHKETSFHAFQVLKKYWKRSEWDMFLLIKDWFDADPENRQDYMSELLSEVRFCLISPQKLHSISKMSIFTHTEGPWEDLVEQALLYHQLPAHLKVLEQSEQSKVRTEPSPVFFTTEDSSTFFALNEKNKWKKYEKKAENIPEFGEYDKPSSIEVNNFLIICTGDHGTQSWHIFDARTLKWSEMADMEKGKARFVLVHHGEHLYAVGGYTKTPSLHTNSPYKWVRSYEMEQYSFKENTWSSIAVPYYFQGIGACVLGDSMYVCGGRIRCINGDETKRSLYSLDLSSPSQEWERKATLTLWESLEDHRVFVACIDGEDVMLAVINDLYMYYYSPAKDQWTYFDWTGLKKYQDSYYRIHGMILVRQNCFYILNVMYCYASDRSDSENDEEEHHMKDRFCLKWEIPKRGWHIKNVPMGNFPLSPRPSREPEVEIFGAILAIPR